MEKKKLSDTEKLCPSCGEVKTVSEFIRPSNGNRSGFYKICNDCEQYNRTLERIRVEKLNKSLTTRKPVIKPVWLVVYRSFP